MGINVSGLDVFDTGPFPADGQPVIMEWKNTSPYVLQIHRVVTWGGMTKDRCGDFVAKTRRKSDGAPITAGLGLDRYDNPSGLHQWADDFGENYIGLVPGDSLVLRAKCSDFSGPAGQPLSDTLAHAVVTIFYSVQ